MFVYITQLVATTCAMHGLGVLTVVFGKFAKLGLDVGWVGE